MAVTALIKYTQAVVGTPGQAYLGVTGSLVTVENDDNTDVLSWEIELLYARPGSALETPPGVPVLLASASSSTPSATFTPDIPGCYRIRLTVYDTAGFTGAKDIDIRNFIVPLPGKGTILPPYQKLPDPLPLTGPGSKPDEMNYEGQAFGWSGNDNLVAKGVNESLAVVDGLVGVPDFSGAAEGDTLQKSFIPLFDQPNGITYDGTHLWVCDRVLPTIFRINPVTQAIVASIDLSPFFTSYAARKIFADTTHVYVANLDADPQRVVVIDKSSNAVVGLADTQDGTARSVVSDGAGSFWVAAKFGTSPGVQRFSLASVLSSFPTAVAPSATIAVTGDAEEVTLGGGFLWCTTNFQQELNKIDPVLDTVISTAIEPSDQTFGVVYAFGSVWVTTSFTGRILRYDPTTNPPTKIATVTPAGLNTIQGITADGSTIWAANAFSGFVYRISTGLGTEAVIATVAATDASDSYQDMTWDGSTIWACAEFSSGVTGGLRQFSTGFGAEKQIGAIDGTPTIEFLPSARLQGDLEGTSILPRVGGLQGFPLAGTPPLFNQVLQWNGFIWTPTTFTGGGGGFDTIVTTSTATTILSDTNTIVLVDSGAGARTIQLPTSPSDFRQFIVKDRDGNASVNNITINPVSNTIDGTGGTYTIATNHGAIYLVWTNSISSSFGWRIL